MSGIMNKIERAFKYPDGTTTGRADAHTGPAGAATGNSNTTAYYNDASTAGTAGGFNDNAGYYNDAGETHVAGGVGGGHHHQHHHQHRSDAPLRDEAQYQARDHHHHNAGPGAAGGYTAGGIPVAALPGPAPTTAGPHRHDILNKLDPRVDSDLSDAQMTARVGPGGRRVPVGNPTAPLDNQGGAYNTAGTAMPAEGAYGAGTHHGLLHRRDQPVDTTGAAAGAPPQAAPGYGPAHGGVGGGVPEGTYGPHRSKLMNALDPRVDSDLDRHRDPAAVPGGPGGYAGAMPAGGRHAGPGQVGPGAMDGRPGATSDRYY